MKSHGVKPLTLTLTLTLTLSHGVKPHVYERSATRQGVRVRVRVS